MATRSCTDTTAPSAVSRSQTARLGESRTSSLSGLNATPSTATRRPATPLPAAEVDLVHRGQQALQRAHPQVRGGGAEPADVFGQAAAAVAEPGRQEPATDPGVVAERLCQRQHVR